MKWNTRIAVGCLTFLLLGMLFGFYIGLTKQLHAEGGLHGISVLADSTIHRGSYPRQEQSASNQPYQPVKYDPKSNWIFYNRMTKSGSRTFVSTLIRTMRKNHRSIIKEYLPTLTNNETLLVAEVSHRLLPFIVVGHHLHVNYTKYDLRQPLGISLIREPVERFLSDFYYIRYGDEQTPKNVRNIPMEIYNRTVEECVDAAIQNDKNKATGNTVVGIGKVCGCQLNHEIVRFCGYDERCKFDQEFALQRAKANLDDYIAVGLTEELPTFFKVLERLLPDLFGGLLQVYNENTGVHNTIRKSKTFSKRRPSDEFLEKLRSLAFREYDFYNFVRERFRNLQMKFDLMS